MYIGGVDLFLALHIRNIVTMKRIVMMTKLPNDTPMMIEMRGSVVGVGVVDVGVGVVDVGVVIPSVIVSLRWRVCVWSTSAKSSSISTKGTL